MATKLTAQETAIQDVERALSQAIADGRWMAAVWSVKDGELKMITRTTWEFPLQDWPRSLDMVRESFSDESLPPIDIPSGLFSSTSPLPEASFKPRAQSLTAGIAAACCVDEDNNGK